MADSAILANLCREGKCFKDVSKVLAVRRVSLESRTNHHLSQARGGRLMAMNFSLV